MADEIVELLKDPKLRAKIVQSLKDIYSRAKTLYDNPDDELRGTDGADRWIEARVRVQGNDASRIIDAFVHVIDTMSRPARVTYDDLAPGFIALAWPLEYPKSGLDCESVYEAFLGFVDNYLLRVRRSPDFEICRCKRFDQASGGVALGQCEDRQEREPTGAWMLKDTLGWSSGNGISVRYSGERIVDDFCHVAAVVEGRMSSDASEELQGEMPRLVKSIVRSVSMLQGCELNYPYLGRTYTPDSLPYLEMRGLSGQRLFSHSCLDAFYGKPRKKSMDKRIRNAVHLLMESDAQSNSALGLALSVTAIEAMLGGSNVEIAEKLSGDVAALLEPEPRRRHQATKLVKKIYGLRSEALHGTDIESEPDVRGKARLLASAILRAMITRREYMRRLGGPGSKPETPDELLEELREGRFRPGQTVGVDEPTVRKLWDGV